VSGPAIIPDPTGDDDCDFTLQGDSAWVTVGTVSIHIHRDKEGVGVNLYRNGEEDDDDRRLDYCYGDFGVEENEPTRRVQ